MNYCSCVGDCGCGWVVKARNGKKVSQIVELIDRDFGIIDPDEVSYVILEPIQGEGGFKVPNRKFMKEIEKVTKQN